MDAVHIRFTAERFGEALRVTVKVAGDLHRREAVRTPLALAETAGLPDAAEYVRIGHWVAPNRARKDNFPVVDVVDIHARAQTKNEWTLEIARDESPVILAHIGPLRIR